MLQCIQEVITVQPIVQKNWRIPYDLALQLEELAASTGQAQQEIIIKALEAYLQEQKGGKGK